MDYSQLLSAYGVEYLLPNDFGLGRGISKKKEEEEEEEENISQLIAKNGRGREVSVRGNESRSFEKTFLILNRKSIKVKIILITASSSSSSSSSTNRTSLQITRSNLCRNVLHGSYLLLLHFQLQTGILENRAGFGGQQGAFGRGVGGLESVADLLHGDPFDAFEFVDVFDVALKKSLVSNPQTTISSNNERDRTETGNTTHRSSIIKPCGCPQTSGCTVTGYTKPSSFSR